MRDMNDTAGPEPAEVDDDGDAGTPWHRAAGTLRIGPLATPKDCRRELGALYRRAARNEGQGVKAKDARALAGILGALVRSIEVDELVQRVEVLERLAGERRK
jgi:hypothetical protein